MNNLPTNFLTKYFIIAVLALGSTPAFSQVSVSIVIAPPPLQAYEQPACPDDGYIWTPGFWAYGDNAYYWVPGAWVQPPEIGDFWTPPYWGWEGNSYVFYSGYWGPNVGYYGGVNYGYGYGGHGYGGGRWQGGHFSYNTAVNNVSPTRVHSTYADRTAINNNASKVSYNGGKGGLQAQPTAQERQASNTRRTQPTSGQQAPVQAASQDKPSAASAPFTGEAVKPAAKPQPKEVNPQPETTIHSQAPIEQKVEPQQEPAQAQQPEHQQQQPAPQQPAQHQEQAQPKQEAKPSQQAPQQTHDKGPAAQPDKKSDNNPNNGPNH